MSRHLTPGAPGRLWLFVVLGALVGALYAAINIALHVGAAHRPPFNLLVTLHDLVDRGIPVLAGALGGVTVHYLFLRSALARRETQRAEELSARLAKVERDQAVWLVAAATLHDARNPLHNLGLLLDEALELHRDDPEAAGDVIRRAREQARRASEAILALRSLADGARPRVEPVRLDLLVDELARDLRPLATDDDVELSVAAHPAVLTQGDARYLRIVLENLVGNSLEALRRRGGPGRVELCVERVSDGSGMGAVVRVRDDGPGLGAVVRARLFEPLLTTRERGLGLGLPVARALARALRGDVVCLDEPGWATSFELRVPAIVPNGVAA